MARRPFQEWVTPCQEEQLRLFGTGTKIKWFGCHEWKGKWSSEVVSSRMMDLFPNRHKFDIHLLIFLRNKPSVEKQGHDIYGEMEDKGAPYGQRVECLN